MSLHRLIYPVFILCFVSIAQYSHAQEKEIGESFEMSKDAVKAKTDSLYFEAVKAKIKNDEPLAIRLFEQFASLRPEVADAFYELSRLSYSDKKLDKAEEYIKKAIAINPRNKWYQEEYASILADRGNFLEAAHIIAELSVSQPQDASYLLTAAEYYERAKKYDDAIAYLDKALVKRGNQEDILMLKEQVYLSMNNVEKAADMVRLIIAKEPRNGKYYKLLGDLYDNIQLPGKAAEVYEKAERTIPGDPYVQYGRAEHFLRIGDTTQYIAYLNKAILNKDIESEVQVEMLSDFIQIMPNDSVMRLQGMPIVRQLVLQHPADAQILWIYGDFLEMNNRHDSAAMAYSKSLQVKSSAAVWRKLLRNFGDRNEADSLIKNSEKFIRQYPNQVDPHYFNAQGYLMKKDYPRAIKAVNRAIDMQPENNKQAMGLLYAFLADIYHAGKQDDLSDKAYDKALSLDPDNASALNNYSYFLSERGMRLDEAEKMSKRSLDLQPGEPTYLDTYGWILYKKGEFEKAKTYIKKAIDLSGARADGTLYDHLGDIYFKLKMIDKAAEYWKLAKEKGVDDPLIDKKISEGKLYE